MQSNNPFAGVMTALVTPMLETGAVDFKSLESLIQSQLRSPIDALLTLGTTGETPTLSAQEAEDCLRLTRDLTEGKRPLLVGVGSYNTEETLARLKKAEALGADGFVVIVPYYNKPTQAGLFAHFSKLAEATRLPIIPYSNPGRCGIEIEVETIARLHAAHPHICGLKEASESTTKISMLRQALGPHFTLLSGNDTSTLPFMSIGADGVVSVVSNAFPELVSQLVSAAAQGDLKEATRIHTENYSLLKHLLCLEVNPVAIKHGLAHLGIIKSNTVRLPLVTLEPANQAKLEATLNERALIHA